MPHHRTLALCCALALAPAAAHAQLKSRSHVLTAQEEVIYRSFAQGGTTSFSIWVRNLQAGPDAPRNLIPTYDSWFLSGLMLGYDTYNQDIAEGTRGNVGVWGSPSITYASSIFQEDDGPGWLEFETYHVNTGIWGCDVPPEAYEMREQDIGEPGFYRTCGAEGEKGWVTLGWSSQGTWTLHGLEVHNAFAGPGDISVTPEPVTTTLLGTGLAAVAAAARRRRKRDTSTEP